MRMCMLTGSADVGLKAMYVVLGASRVSELGVGRLLMEVIWARQRMASCLEAGKRSLE